MPWLQKSAALALALAVCCAFLPFSLNAYELGPVTGVRDTGVGMEVTLSNATFWVEAIEPGILRVRLGVGGNFLENTSYALKEGFKPKGAPYRIEQNASEVRLNIESLAVVFTRHKTGLRVEDQNGNVLIEEFAPLSWEDAALKPVGPVVQKHSPPPNTPSPEALPPLEPKEGHAVLLTLKLGYDEHFYGLGEKALGLDLRRTYTQMWNTDAFGYGPGDDPLYQSHPFLIGLKKGVAFGMFLDNSYRTHFDLGKEFEDRYRVQTEGGELDLYLIAGPKVPDVAQRYATLTGTMPMPPSWALGHMLCRYSYYPDNEVLDIAKRARQERIPTDVVWLDIHYMDGYRVFTWDKSRFSDLPGLTQSLHAMDMKAVSMIDPGVKADPGYGVFKEGIERDAFLKYPDGGLYIGKVWPGDCVFPDFSRKDVREWWGGLYRGLVDAGIDGFWNDMNEPAVFDVPGKTMDDGVMFDDSGLISSHKKMHNVFGLLMVKASYEGVQALESPKRPFLLSRAGFSGVQRYAAVWTGDNTSSFPHLRLQNPMFLNMGLSGVPFVGSDIGGFEGSPTPELLVRWYEASALVPLMRNHTNRGSYDQEPWVFGEPYTDLIRKAIGLRYRLLPYLYSAFFKASTTGEPILHPLVYAYQDDPATYSMDDAFLVGDSLLVAPVLEPGAQGRYVYLPRGVWYDHATKGTLSGQALHYVSAPLGTLPLFVKEGSVIPTTQEGQHVSVVAGETATLEVYPAVEASGGHSFFYMDDGKTTQSPYNAFDFQLTRTPDGLSVAIAQSGSYALPRRFHLKVYGKALSSAHFQGRPVPVSRAGGSSDLEIPAQAGTLNLLF